MMESLQIVWMISCHYNSDERMVPLMERIAWQLCERVAQGIDVHKLFKYVWMCFNFMNKTNTICYYVMLILVSGLLRF